MELGNNDRSVLDISFWQAGEASFAIVIIGTSALKDTTMINKLDGMVEITAQKLATLLVYIGFAFSLKLFPVVLGPAILNVFLKVPILFGFIEAPSFELFRLPDELVSFVFAILLIVIIIILDCEVLNRTISLCPLDSSLFHVNLEVAFDRLLFIERNRGGQIFSDHVAEGKLLVGAKGDGPMIDAKRDIFNWSF